MKKILSVVMILCLLLPGCSFALQYWTCPNCNKVNTTNYCPFCGQMKPADITDTDTSPFADCVYALAIERVASRSGPGTEYTELGTYKVKGQYIKILSYTYDCNGVCWVQCEVPYGGLLRRVYTGLKRFDTCSFDMADVPEEYPLEITAHLNKSISPKYGPGDDYCKYNDIKFKKGKKVTVNFIDGDWAQIQFINNSTLNQGLRVWVPESVLEY